MSCFKVEHDEVNVFSGDNLSKFLLPSKWRAVIISTSGLLRLSERMQASMSFLVGSESSVSVGGDCSDDNEQRVMSPVYFNRAHSYLTLEKRASVSPVHLELQQAYSC